MYTYVTEQMLHCRLYTLLVNDASFPIKTKKQKNKKKRQVNACRSNEAYRSSLFWKMISCWLVWWNNCQICINWMSTLKNSHYSDIYYAIASMLKSLTHKYNIRINWKSKLDFVLVVDIISFDKSLLQLMILKRTKIIPVAAFLTIVNLFV